MRTFIILILFWFGLSSCNLKEPDFKKSDFLELSQERKKVVGIEPNDNAQKIRKIGMGGSSLQAAIEKDPEILAYEYDVLNSVQDARLILDSRSLQTSFKVNGGSLSLRDQENGVYGEVTGRKVLYDGDLAQQNVSSAEISTELAYLRYSTLIDTRVVELLGMYSNYRAQKELYELTAIKLLNAKTLLRNLIKLNDVGQVDATQLNDAQDKIDKFEADSRASKSEYESTIRLIEDKFGVDINKIFIKLPSVEDHNLQEIIDSYPINNEQKIALIDQKLSESRLVAHKKSRWGTLSAVSKIDVPMENSSIAPDASIGIVFERVLGDGGVFEREKDKLKISVLRASEYFENVTQNKLKSNEKLVSKIEMLSTQLDDYKKLRKAAEEKVSYLEDQISVGISDFNALLSAHLNLFEYEKNIINYQSELSIAFFQFLLNNNYLNSLIDYNYPLAYRF